MAGVNKTVEQIVFEGVDKISGVTKQAQSSVNQLRQSVDAVKGALAAVGVTVGAGAMVALYYDTLKAVAALDNMAEATGASVEGLSAIQRVAKVGGHDFEGLTQQIGRMVKGLKDGGEEGTKTQNAMKALGISTRDAGGHWRDTSAIIIDLANKLDKYKDGVSKTQLVQDALGKGAERYIPLLKDIAEKTDLQATVTAKQALAAEEAEKNIKRLELAMFDSRRELVIQYTPAIIDFTERLLAATRASGGLVAGLAQMAMQPLGLSADERLKQVNEEITRREAVLSKKPGALQDVFGLGETVVGTKLMAGYREREYLQSVIKMRDDMVAKKGAAGPGSQLFEFPQPKPELDYKGLADRKALEKREQEVRDAQHKARVEQDTADLKWIEFANKKREDLETARLKADEDIAAKSAALIVSGRSGEEEQLATRGPRGDVTPQLAALKASISTEEEIQNEARKMQLAAVAEFTDQELQLLGGRYEVEQRIEMEHQDRISAIRRRGITTTLEFEKASFRQRAGFIAGTIADMTSTVASGNRTMFELNKIAGIANVALTLPEKISDAYKWGNKFGGPVVGAAFAAIAAAAGLTHIAMMQSQTFGGNAGVAPSLAGGTPAQPVTPVTTGGAQAGEPPVLQVIIQGHVLGTKEFVDETLIPALREAIDNRDFIIIGQNSRQAANLTV